MSAKEQLKAKGVSVMDRHALVAWHVRRLVERNLMTFMGHQEVMNNVETRTPEQFEALQKDPLSLSLLTTVCRECVRERVPIVELSVIVDTTLRLGKDGHTAAEIVAEVRMAEAMRSQLPGNDGAHELWVLPESVERELLEGSNAAGTILSMARARRDCIVSALFDRIGIWKRVALLVRNPRLRPLLRALLEDDLPHVPVLAREELIETAGRALQEAEWLR